MILPPTIEAYARDRGIGPTQALQVFLQVIVLKNLALAAERLIGGCALVMGHGNPRFSEDIDLTGAKDPKRWGPRLEKAGSEAQQWMPAAFKLTPPKTHLATWKLTFKPEGGGHIRLHLDSQPYRALSHHPVVVAFPGIPPFVVPSVSADEIMADKLVALALRNYVSGRDIFDLWYHWMKGQADEERDGRILGYLREKLRERSAGQDIIKVILHRLGSSIPMRARDEFDRYLPSGLRMKGLYEEIFSRTREGIGRLKA